MCNSDRLLEYSAVTAMIDHENDDRGGKNSDWIKLHFGRHPELWLFHKRSKYRHEKREKLGFEVT